jgi:hypothetical protein
MPRRCPSCCRRAIGAVGRSSLTTVPSRAEAARHLCTSGRTDAGERVYGLPRRRPSGQCAVAPRVGVRSPVPRGEAARPRRPRRCPAAPPSPTAASTGTSTKSGRPDLNRRRFAPRAPSLSFALMRTRVYRRWRGALRAASDRRKRRALSMTRCSSTSTRCRRVDRRSLISWTGPSHGLLVTAHEALRAGFRC